MPILMLTKPGLMIINAPHNPRKTAVHRFSLEGSAIKAIAPIDVNNGVIKAKAMTVAKGMIVIAV